MAGNEVKGAVVVQVPRCTGCGRCVAACPDRLLTLEVSGYRKHAVLTAPQYCTGCLKCVVACPVGAMCPADDAPPAPTTGEEGD